MTSKRATVVDNLVAERVRAYRKQLGLSQSQVANQLGLTFQQIQKYEKGTNRIGAGRLFDMARLFNVPVQALFPECEESIDRAKNATKELKEISDFVASADGWRLCHAFLKIKDPQRRKTIIALVHGITEP